MPHDRIPNSDDKVPVGLPKPGSKKSWEFHENQFYETLLGQTEVTFITYE